MNIILKKINRNFTAITIGDIDGIGIHLLIKEFKNKRIKNFVLFTNLLIFYKKFKYLEEKINIINIEKEFNYNKNKINIIDYNTKNKYTNTLDSLKFAYKLTKKKYFTKHLFFHI